MPRRNTGAKLRWFPERGAYYICWTVNGRSRKCSTGTAEREEAEISLADWLQVRSRTITGPSDPAKTLITDCLAFYAEERGPKIIGRETMANAIDNLTEFWIERVVTDINPNTCSRYCTVRGVGTGTTRRELGVLQAAINWAYRNGRLTRTVAVQLPEAPQPKKRWLTRSEAARLLRASRTPEARGYMPLFILLGLYTGRRKEALLSLRWPQIDLHVGVIDFDLPGRKITKKTRGKCRIPSSLLPHLIRARRRGADLSYVLNIEGRRIGDIKKGFAAACRRAGLEDVTPHTLRHTAVTWRLNNEVNTWDVGGFIGMSPRTVEAVYGHHGGERMQETANAVKVRNGALKGA